MLFTNIAALVSKGINITLAVEAGAEGKLDVTLTPISQNAAANKSGVSLVARTFTGTPSELDEQFAEIVKTFGAATQSLAEQLAAATQVIDSAAKQASENAVKATTSKPATKTASKPGSPALKTPAAKAEPELLGSTEETEDDDGGESATSPAETSAPAASTATGDTTMELTL